MVLTRSEVSKVLSWMRGAEWPVVCLLYGAGLRLSEALCLRTVSGAGKTMEPTQKTRSSSLSRYADTPPGRRSL
jgi:hypothetical protein